ncbi:restriction endonuclease subunit S [Flavobacterium sp.]|uniref:restriction endonuclease subunit S n=1 Tax=Flavobacterium sp. TaxID=239 RepID=UPI00286B0DF5|nr:restriction endonuclease subunit S [Flavobacterium sp.]
MRKYDDYIYSGIELFGQIPLHWEVKRLKNIFSFSKGLTITKKDLLEDGVPCINYGEIHSKYGFEVNPSRHFLKCVDENYLITSKSSLLSKGDFVFSDTSEDIDGSGNFTYLNSDIRIFAGYHTIIAKPIKVYSYRYLAYLLDSLKFRNQIRSNVAGIKVYSITQGLLKRLYIFLPSSDEQTLIVNYLDSKTQAIDKKINLLTQKASYYKEYRKSLINETVCKGLDKDVKLKESEVHYINSIAKHWKTERIKDLFNIGRGRVIGQELLVEDGKYPVYSSQTENNGCLGYIETYDFDNDLLTWTTDGANAGTVFRRSGKFNCTNVCGTLIPKRKNLDLDYVVYALQESASHNKRIDTNGAKIMNNEMGVIKIVFPSLSEQTQIADYLDKKTQTIDKLVSNINAQIQTMKELRKTLINDTVIGKIKIVS